MQYTLDSSYTTSSPSRMAHYVAVNLLTPESFDAYLSRNYDSYCIGESEFSPGEVLRSRPGAYDEELARYRSDNERRTASRLRNLSEGESFIVRGDHVIRAEAEPPVPDDSTDGDGVNEPEASEPDTEKQGFIVTLLNRNANKCQYQFDTLPDALAFAAADHSADHEILLRVYDAATGEEYVTAGECSSAFPGFPVVYPTIQDIYAHPTHDPLLDAIDPDYDWDSDPDAVREEDA